MNVISLFIYLLTFQCLQHVFPPFSLLVILSSLSHVRAGVQTCLTHFFDFQQNKQILIDAVVHAVNEDYAEMANDFTRLGFLAPGTDVSPIVPALEAIWQNSVGKGLADFNFRSVTGNFFLLHSLVFFSR